MQLDLICSYLWLILGKGFLYISLPYYFYTRVIDVYLCYYHYNNQAYKKVSCVGFPLPIIGNLMRIQKALGELIRANDHKLPFVNLIEQ